MKNNNAQLFHACNLQGRLFLHDQLQSALARKNARQKDADYDLPPGCSLKDEISRAFQIARNSWSFFTKRLQRANASEEDLRGDVRTFARYFFQSALGYSNFKISPERTYAGDRGFAIQAFAEGLPVVFVPGNVELDSPVSELAVENGSHARKSAFQNVQEFLNASADCSWGFAFNGRSIRLVRDAMSLTRPSFLEFNLDEIFQADSYSEFLQLWAVLHASRAKVINKTTAWDLWIKAGEEQGQPIRDGISYHVRLALEILGGGFLKAPANTMLRDALQTGRLSKEEYLRELLRLLYRFLFVFCLEERNLLNTEDEKNDQASERYREGYALHRFCEESGKRRFRNQHVDAWESVKVVWRALGKGEPRLALPALGGLFRETACPHLDASQLQNKAFFEAMWYLRWADINGVVARIDYRNLGTEELGSIYEGLLELIPVVDLETGAFGFAGASAGNDRKDTGSYYTPDSLVQSLIKTALDPVIEKAVTEHPEDPVKALLALKVIDPTCGSGHFLLAAARRIAEKVALFESPDGAVTPDAYREALRSVIQHCIYGVDINPLSIELARMALWLEGYSRGKPLSFLDHHLKVGNSVIGVMDLKQLGFGISKVAYKGNLPGEDSNAAKVLAKENAAALKQLQGMRLDESGQGELFGDTDVLRESINTIEKIDTNTLAGIEATERAYLRAEEALKSSHVYKWCDLYMAGYLAPKRFLKGSNTLLEPVPTTAHLLRSMIHATVPGDEEIQRFSSNFCREQKVFHWPLEFFSVVEQGGFDCILGNPPWEKAKIEDKQWFSVREPRIANADTGAKRARMVAALKNGEFHEKYCELPYSEASAEAEKALYKEYIEALRTSGANAVYGHVKGKEGGRFPLVGVGDTNLYAYVAETMLYLRKDGGAIGLVVPPGLVTDAACQAFAEKVLNGGIAFLYQFENTEKIFPIHSSYAFALITLRKSDKMDCVFYASNVSHIEDPRRKVTFLQGDFAKFNPNTKTCFFPRTQKDLDIMRKIYDHAPVLVNENAPNGNPWKIRNLRMFDMTNDSGLFRDDNPDGTLVPLYEGKLIHQFDNRFATYELNKKGKLDTVNVTDEQKQNPNYRITPKFWVDPKDVAARFVAKAGQRWWDKPWMLGFRGISRATDQRTVICSVLTSMIGAGNSIPLIFPKYDKNSECIFANLNSLVVDFIDRIKQAGPNFNIFILNQLPVFDPNTYCEDDIEYINKRVAKLTKNSSDVSKVWMTNYPEYPYQSAEERLQLRAELDAYYAHLYGLSREDLQYILDPEKVCGKGWPSITFPGLKRDEIKAYGEFLTERLVLEAYDKLAESPRFKKADS